MSHLIRSRWGQVYIGLEDIAAWDRWRERGELFVRLGRLFLIITPQRAIEQARWRGRRFSRTRTERRPR